MFKIRRGDLVKVTTGKDRGKTGKVLMVFPGDGKCLVERINLIKKHLRRRSADQQPGIVERENPVSISNLMFVCGKCNRTTRVEFRILQDRSKVRVCKRCKEIIS